jgi:hypothetical protein
MYGRIENIIQSYSAPSFSSSYSSNSFSNPVCYDCNNSVKSSMSPRIYDFVSGSNNLKYNSSSNYFSNSSGMKNIYSFSSSDFINPYANRTRFVDDASDIKDLIEQSFEATTGKELPNDIIISICSEQKMKEFHSDWHPGIEGFAINSCPKMVFVKQSELANVMVTLGHELGHVFTAPLNDARDEEAKAFAFSIAWINAIKEKNIGNLSDSLVIPKPAQNGLHNVALDFVIDCIKEGKEAFDLFWDLVFERTSCSVC